MFSSRVLKEFLVMKKSQHTHSLCECRKFFISNSWREPQKQDDSWIRQGIQRGIWALQGDFPMSVSKSVLYMSAATGYICHTQWGTLSPLVWTAVISACISYILLLQIVESYNYRIVCSLLSGLKGATLSAWQIFSGNSSAVLGQCWVNAVRRNAGDLRYRWFKLLFFT